MIYNPSYQILGLLLHTVPSSINMIPSPGHVCLLDLLPLLCDSLTAERSLVLKRPAHAYSRHHDLEQILQ